MEGIDGNYAHPRNEQSDPALRRADRAWWHYGIAALGLIAVLLLALRFARPEQLWQLLTHANPWWLAGALLFKMLTPFGTAAVYQRVLRLLGYRASARLSTRLDKAKDDAPS